MKGYSVICAFIAALFGNAVVNATQPVRWLETSYDFGLIKEYEGEKEGFVRFVNPGPEEAVVMGARPSCGCTDVVIPEEPVAPGDTAVIRFSYNPLGRPGKFDKTIRVYMGPYDTQVIRITGNVLGTPESLSILYPVELGPLRLTEPTINGGEVDFGRGMQVFLNAYNASLDSVTPGCIIKDKALSAEMTPQKAGPGDIVTFSFYYNSRQKGDVGNIEIPVTFVANMEDPFSETRVVPFRVNVLPPVNTLSAEEREKAPSIFISPSTLEAGIITNPQSVRSFSFNILNEGKSPLRIERSATPDNVKVRRYPVTLRPGKSGKLEGSFDPSSLPQGPFKLPIQIYSTDPVTPVTTIYITGEIR